MAAKNDNLPINADIDLQNGGTIKYANEVIAIIAGVAASEVDGIAGMCTSGGIGDIISRNRNITRGIKIEMGGEEVSVDIYTIVEYGQPIHKVALEVQENVRKAIETMTGLHVVKVDVHVQGVSFEKENKEQSAAIEAVKTPALEEAKPRKKNSRKAAQERKPEEPVKDKPAPEEPKKEEQKPEESVPEEAPVKEEPAVETEPVPEAPDLTAEAPAEEIQADPTIETKPETETIVEEAPAEQPAEPTAEETPSAETETVSDPDAAEAEVQPADLSEEPKKAPKTRKPRRRA